MNINDIVLGPFLDEDIKLFSKWYDKDYDGYANIDGEYRKIFL